MRNLSYGMSSSKESRIHIAEGVRVGEPNAKCPTLKQHALSFRRGAAAAVWGRGDLKPFQSPRYLPSSFFARACANGVRRIASGFKEAETRDQMGCPQRSRRAR